MPYALIEGGTITEILGYAAEVLTWIITQMGAVVDFVVGQPLILVGFIVSLAGLGINFFLRLFKSV